MADLLSPSQIARVRIDKLAEVAFAWLQNEAIVLLLEAGEVHRITIERNNLHRVLGARPAQDVPCLHQEVGGAVLFDDAATLGQERHHLLVVACVVHDEAEQLTTGRPVTNVKREIVLRTGKASGLDDLGDEVGANLDHVVAQQPEAPRHAEVIDERYGDRHQQR